MEKEKKSALLEVEGLHVHYRTRGGEVYALNGLDLAVERGERLGLVGETGAGKTTLALSILRLLPEDAGRVCAGSIRFEGEELLEQSEAWMLGLRGRRISMIFQDPMTSLDPIKSVGEQVGEVLKLHFPGMSAQERSERTDRMLELVGIPASRRGDFPYQFSGGMKQRIVIAMALIGEPELLLADEPTTALDVTIQAQILELMHRLGDELGTAVILITHDLGVVAEFCDRVAVVYGGRIVEQGTVEQVFEGVGQHPYTRGLLGCIPELDSRAERLTPIPGRMPDPTKPPSGCSFAERCPQRSEACLGWEPRAFESEGHSILCRLYAQEEG